MSAFQIILKSDLNNIVRNPILLMSQTVFPFLLICILGYITKHVYGEQFTSYHFYGITILIFNSLNVSIIAANSFMEQAVIKSNLRILNTPIPSYFLYLSKIVATFVATSMATIILMGLIDLLLDVPFYGISGLYVALVLITLNLFSSALGVLMCCIFKSEEVSNKILSLVNNVLAFIGGLFFQWNGLGKFAEVISNLSPIKWVADASFQIVYDDTITLALPICGFLIAGTVLMLYACKLVFKEERYL